MGRSGAVREMVDPGARQMQGRGDGVEAGRQLRDADERERRALSPHLDACFLAVDAEERIVFTNALTGGWRPARQPFITAIITLRDHPDGTEYVSHAMHKSPADRAMHDEMGFYDGWGTAIGQLAELAERQAA